MASDFLSVVSDAFGKIASFFDVFDLSFFVSGALCLAAISFWFELSETSSPSFLDNWMGTFELVIFCYVLGLMTFTSGRWLRTGFVGRKFRCTFRRLDGELHRAYKIFLEAGEDQKSASNKGNIQGSKENTEHQSKHLNSREYFQALLSGHGLKEQEIIRTYDRCYSNTMVADCLYQRMWAEIRQCRELAPSLTMLNRWWVLTATYDGIAMNLIFYALIIIIWLNGIGLSVKNSDLIMSHPYHEYSFVAIFILLMLSIASFREAGRLEINQRAEIAATMAHFCGNPKYLCKADENQENANQENAKLPEK
jgi:hypothetical protein